MNYPTISALQSQRLAHSLSSVPPSSPSHSIYLVHASDEMDRLCLLGSSELPHLKLAGNTGCRMIVKAWSMVIFQVCSS